MQPDPKRKQSTLPAGELIVVADDNADVLLLIAKRLAKRGFEVETATDGWTALEMIRTRGPAAAVLDWVMPMMQGSEVCAEVKSDPATADIPVIFLTARAAKDDIACGFASGADEYLTKPFDIEVLASTLRRLIRPSG